MDQDELFPLVSPCIGVCTADNRGYCKGCARSREERFYWNRLSNLQKRQVITLCQRRLKRRQQRAAKKAETAAPQPSLQRSLFDD